MLVEKEARRGDLFQARTRDFKTVMLPREGIAVGEYHTVELTGTTGSTFTGAVVDATDRPRRAGLPMVATAA